MKKTFDNPEAMDLQLFAIDLTPEQQEQLMRIVEGEGAESENQSVDDTQENENQNIENTESQDNANEGQSEGTPQNGKILGKFNSVDDLVNAYKNLESFTTQTRQELSETKQILDQLQAMLKAQQNGMPQPVQGQTEPVEGQMDQQNDEEFDSEKFMEMFYDNPQEAIKQVVEKLVKPEIEPIKQKIEDDIQYQNWVRRVNEFARKTPDLAKWQNDIKLILQQNPELKNDPKGLEKAYAMAKGMRYQDPSQLLQDEEFVNQNILQNEEIRNKIIQDYLSQLKKGTPPASIGTGPVSGSTPVTPPNRPTTMEEANKMALELFNK